MTQAYRNGTVVSSWLVTAAPVTAFAVHQYKPIASGYAFPLGPVDALRLLSIGLFCGTTAHLLGATLAGSRGDGSRQVTETERRELLVVLVLSGILFGYFHVVPFFP